MQDIRGLVAAAKARLAEIESEREVLLRFIGFYEDGGKRPATPHSTPNRTSSSPSPATMQRQVPPSFLPTPGGPTETVLSVVKEQPGIAAADLIDQVIPRMHGSNAKKPRRTVASTAAFLVQRGQLRKIDGRFYPSEGGA